MNWVPLAICLAAGFLIGSIPFAYIIVKRIKGIDVRSQGSRNAGATNAARVLGWRWGIAILALDAAKGALAAWMLPLAMGLIWNDTATSLAGFLTEPGLQLLMGIAAFLGHCFSPFLAFRGGKGVATGLGVYLVVAWQAALLALAICVPIILLTRIVSVASITGAVLLPAGILIFHDWGDPEADSPWVVFAITLLIGLLIIFRHRANIRRLIEGKENRA